MVTTLSFENCIHTKNAPQSYGGLWRFARVGSSFMSSLYFLVGAALRWSSVFCIGFSPAYNQLYKKLTFTLANRHKPTCLRSLTFFCCGLRACFILTNVPRGTIFLTFNF